MAPKNTHNLQAIITRVDVCDKSAGPRYQVGITCNAFTQVKVLTRGPWCKKAAERKRDDLQDAMDNGAGFADRLYVRYAG